MRKLMLVMMVSVLLLNIAGCSNKENEFDHIRKNAESFDNKEAIIQGLQTKEIDLISDPFGKGRDSLVYLFTDHLGELTKASTNDKDVKVLYGPYDGSDLAKITVSNLEITYENNLEKIEIDNKDMQYTIINNRMIIFSHQQDVYFTYEAKVTEPADKQRNLEQFAEALDHF